MGPSTFERFGEQSSGRCQADQPTDKFKGHSRAIFGEMPRLLLVGRTPLSAALLLLLLLKLLGKPEQQAEGSRNKSESTPEREMFVKMSENIETSEEEVENIISENSCRVTNPKTGDQVGNDVHLKTMIRKCEW